jgi:hypothetical protein
MAITSYPRTTVQGSGVTQNPQNGIGLMVLNPSTQKYEAATAATFSGGGGGGDATAANQSTQITEAQTTNSRLIAYGTSAAEYLNNIQNNTAGLATSSNQTSQQTTLNDILTKLGDIYNLLNNGTAKVQLYDGSGGAVIGTTAGRLNVDTGA